MNEAPPKGSGTPRGSGIAATVDAALTTRRSVRGFLPDPVPKETIRHILQVSARAPSGTNIQPWFVWA
ncbi:MAG: nitroreductase family protein, partial [Alphaproteobacteria bacterium]|nr:nitroreductase family protein [Alphaproteobacteria bacterium]